MLGSNIKMILSEEDKTNTLSTKKVQIDSILMKRLLDFIKIKSFTETWNTDVSFKTSLNEIVLYFLYQPKKIAW